MVDVLAFGAHPDDLEFACGGILSKLAAQGKSIAMVTCTNGEKGTSGTVEVRKRESEAAAAVIGAKCIFLGMKDCEIFDTIESRTAFARVIRQEKPKLVLAPLWKGESNHPDHLACGLIARTACRFARFAKILPDLPIHWVEGILHYVSPLYGVPDILVDVSQQVETWKRMMHCHVTQVQQHNYPEWNLRLASKLGLLCGVEYAQGLVHGNPILVENLMHVAKGTREI